MKLCDFISIMPDNYLPIKINVVSGLKIIKSYDVEPHSRSCQHIPEDIWKAEVFSYILYYDKLVIDVKENDYGNEEKGTDC